MGEFIAILTIYYMCDSVAGTRPLAGDELNACSAAYEEVKTYFIEEFELAPHGSLERFEQNRQGYLGFKAWEAENAELVSKLRHNADAEVRLGVAY
ncbi:MAG: hypothetical protein AAF771_14305 [Pseudomonadota bacterium]